MLSYLNSFISYFFKYLTKIIPCQLNTLNTKKLQNIIKPILNYLFISAYHLFTCYLSSYYYYYYTHSLFISPTSPPFYSPLLQQSEQLHAYVHDNPALKHSQYFFWHCDFLQLHVLSTCLFVVLPFSFNWSFAISIFS